MAGKFEKLNVKITSSAPQSAPEHAFRRLAGAPQYIFYKTLFYKDFTDKALILLEINALFYCLKTQESVRKRLKENKKD